MKTETVQAELSGTAPFYWSYYFEPFFLPVYKKALAQLSLTKRELLLNVGSASGLFDNMAMATGAMVSGIEPDPGLLEIARVRNPKTNLLKEDLDNMPFADESFDVVTCFNPFRYANDFENIIAEANRTLKPDGCLVIGLCDKPELNDATSIFEAISSLIPQHAPVPNPFALSEEGEIERIFRKTGLKMIRATRVPCPFLYQRLRAGIKSFMGTGMAAAAANYYNKEIVEETIAAALQPYQITEDLYFLQNHFLLYIAEKQS